MDKATVRIATRLVTCPRFCTSPVTTNRAFHATLYVGVDTAQVDVNRQQVSPMPFRVIDDDRRTPEAHRLVVEERGIECPGMIALEPGGLVNQNRKGRRVGLGKSIPTKCSQRVEDTASDDPLNTLGLRAFQKRQIEALNLFRARLAPSARQSCSPCPAVNPARSRATFNTCS